jgi:serine/threonine protein kinase
VPERWLGDRAKEASDIYSFGVLAHGVLAGELPFKGPNLGEQPRLETPPS